MMVVQSEACNSNSVETVDDKKQRLRQRFQVVKKLGQGTYGKVQLAINKETKQEVAVKTIRKAKIENEQDLLRIRREIQIMSSVQHPHIIHIYEVFENSEKIVFIMQYASGGELYDYLGCHKKLPEKEARRIFRQIAAAIYYCHKNKICHRDLKLENILLDDKGNAKIADFGLSNVFEEKIKLHTFCGSPLYASPEIVKGTPYCGPEVDCWSLGVLLYTLVYGAMPFDGSNFKRLVRQISEGDYYEPKFKSKASGIIRRLLTVDVNSRADIKDICNDEWVNEGYDHSLLEAANDLASLTPVSMSALPTLSRKNEPISISMKNNLLTNLPMIYHNQKLNHDPVVKNECTNFGQATSSKIIEDRKRIHAIIAAKISNDSVISNGQAHLMSNGSSGDPNNFQKLFCNRIKKNSFTFTERNDCVNGEFYSPDSSLSFISPTAKSKEIFADKIPSKHNMNLEENKRIENNNELLSSHALNHMPNGISTKHIPDANTTLQRTSAVEKFRAWRANLNQMKSNETESIVPVFEVTSIIPKRLNNKEIVCDFEKNSQEKIETQETYRSININPQDESKEMAESNDPAICNDDISYTSTTTTKRKESLTAAKERNDVIDFLNQVCSQRVLSNELKKQFALTLQAETPLVKQCLEHKVENSKKGIIKDIDSNSKNDVEMSISPHSKQTEIAKEKNCNSVTESIEVDEKVLVPLRKEIRCTKNVETYPQGPDCKNFGITDAKTDYGEIEECNTLNEPNINFVPSTSGHKNATINEFPNTSCVRLNEDIMFTEELNLEKLDLSGKRNSTTERLDTSNCDIESRNPPVISHDLTDPTILPLQYDDDEVTEIQQSDEVERVSRSNCKKKTKTRSCSVDNDERMSDLEKILRRPRKYSLCALLAASFEFEKLVTSRTRRKSECFKKPPGKVTIPKSFDPSSESEASTIDRKEIVLIPSISVAENKQKMETKIEKVKLSALSLKPKRKSEANTRRKLKKYTRSCTDVLQCIGNLSDTVNVYQNTANLCCDLNVNGISSSIESRLRCSQSNGNSECRYAAVNFLGGDESVPSETLEGLEMLSLGYVPITRCCKKITFPTKCSANAENKHTWSENCDVEINTSFTNLENIDNLEHQNDLLKERKIGGKRKLSIAKHLKRKTVEKDVDSESSTIEEKRSASFSYESQESYSNIDQSQSIESLNSSSFEHDSSDNDDELNTMVLDSNLEQYASGDLWNFLKSINNDISHQIKKVKRNPTKPTYSRSKSQECNMLKNSGKLEKSFIRSLSKEEKLTHQIRKTSSASSEEVCSNSSLGDEKYSLKNVTQTNNLSHNPSNRKTELKNNDFKNVQKTKYHSLSNLHDSQSMYIENNLLENHNNSSSELFMKSINETGCSISNKNFSYNSLPHLDQQSIFGTIRPRTLAKSQRSQSYMMLDGIERDYSMDRPKSLSRVDLRRNDKEHSNTVRNKALSDLDMSLKHSNALNYNDGNEMEKLRFAKSLESKLSLEPRSILWDSRPKSHQRNKLKDDIMLKKRGRRVSFTVDAANEQHSNFAKESLAKAQKALSNVERSTPANNDANEDQGTLLEALKTQGYKSIMSQRLQNTDEMQNTAINRRYSLAYLMKYNPSMDDERLFSSPTSQSLIDPVEFAQRIRWSRNFLRSLEEVSDEYNDIDYSDLNSYEFNDSMFNNETEINWGNLPNTWLYKNTEDLRSSRLSRDKTVPLNCNSNNSDWSKFKNEYILSKQNIFEDSSDINLGPCTSFDSNEDSIFKSEKSRNSEKPIEKLSMKIKALKNRCQQKPFDETILRERGNSSVLDRHVKSFDDSLLDEDGIGEELEGLDKRVARTKRYDVDTSPCNNLDNDSHESVSDRIWRKSFYSRFNDTSSLRRRRSMLFEQEYPQEELFLKAMKFRAPDYKEREKTLPKKTILMSSNESIDKTRYISKPDMDQHSKSSAERHENIPNHLKIGIATNDLTDSLNEANVDD